MAMMLAPWNVSEKDGTDFFFVVFQEAIACRTVRLGPVVEAPAMIPNDSHGTMGSYR